MNHPPRNTDLHSFEDSSGERWFYCSHDLIFQYNGLIVRIPRRFLSDGYSIPKFAQGWFSKAGKGLLAAVLHDYLYRKGVMNGVTKKEADMLLSVFMKAYGHGWSRRMVVLAGLKVGGWTSWKKRYPRIHPLN